MTQPSSIDPSRFAPDYESESYWWMAAPRPPIDEGPLQSHADIVIVGSGVTGLNAARELARGSRTVVVLDSGQAGIGATSRNAGNIGRVLKHEFTTILEKRGADTAVRLYREMQAAYDAVEQVVIEERINCNYRKCGRLILCHTDKQMDTVAKECKAKRKHLGEEYELLDKAGVDRELDTPLYVGAAYLPDSASIHPGLYHLGLLAAAQREGVSVVGGTHVQSIAPGGVAGSAKSFTVTTSRGPITAREVIVATNGYTGPGLPPWFKNRLVPFDAYMIATDEITPERMARLLPTNRVYIDANRNLDFFRQSPDGRRVLFGGRTGARRPADLRAIALALFDDACRVLPALREQKIGRGWTGRCAGTFDLYPHMGEHDGIRYAAGYCFAGIPMGTYLGRKLASQILGRPEGATAFAERDMPGSPLYNGNPWFVPYFMKFYDWMDRRDGGRP